MACTDCVLRTTSKRRLLVSDCRSKALLAIAAAIAISGGVAGQQARGTPAPVFFTTRLTVDEMKGKQAVIDTDLGTIIIDLLPEAAPNHVGLFIKTAQDGGYTGTIFHRVIKDAIIQGGDPLTADPAKVEQYGTGGLRQLK